MTGIQLEQLPIHARAHALPRGGLLLEGSPVSVDLPAHPERYLVSGWQSWSLTAWVDTTYPLRPMRPARLHPMQTDPTTVLERRPHGAWYGAAEFSGEQIVFLGALALDARVVLDGRTLIGTTDAGPGEGFLGVGGEQELLERYAQLLSERLGCGRARTPPRVWCSWYSLYTGIREQQLLKVLHDLGDLPFEVFQVDDGWQRAIGDWQANEKFPAGMDSLARRIQDSGRTAGLWLAPLLVVPSSSVYRDHPDWLLKDDSGQPVSAGFNWGEPLFALDTTHPRVLDWLADLMRQVRAWGYGYAKLDFLYAGALPGKRHTDLPREAAFRQGLQVIREALGEAYLLTCGAPILPSLGLCDGLRVGPDVAEYWSSRRDDELLRNFTTPGGRNSLRSVVHHLWLKALVHTDPDVVYFRSRRNDLNADQRLLLQDLGRAAGFKATSDIPAWMEDRELSALRAYLEEELEVSEAGRGVYQIGDRRVDFSAHLGLPPRPGPITRLAGGLLGTLAEQPAVLRWLYRHGLRSLARTLDHNPV